MRLTQKVVRFRYIRLIEIATKALNEENQGCGNNGGVSKGTYNELCNAWNGVARMYHTEGMNES